MAREVVHSPAEPATRQEAEAVLEEALARYLTGEARELAAVEAQVCGSCGYAAGVHADYCSRFARVVGR